MNVDSLLTLENPGKQPDNPGHNANKPTEVEQFARKTNDSLDESNNEHQCDDRQEDVQNDA